MKNSAFQPGFRFSAFDAAILLAGAVGAGFAWRHEWWLGALIAFVVLHFFLFCNVFRISRKPELVWAAVMVLLSGSAILFQQPSWAMVFTFGIALSFGLIVGETRHPGYHGIHWQKWNPNLRTWWDGQNSQ